MKQFFSYFGASLVAIAALSSCNKELTDPNEGIKGGIPFEICASTTDTKTAIDEAFKTTWVVEGTADQINLYHKEASAAAYTYDNAFTAQTAGGKFSGKLTSALEAEKEYQWLAKYPYDKDLTTPANDYSYIGSRSDRTQSQTGVNNTAHLSGYYMPLVGKGTSVGTASPTITMEHASSVIEINVTNNTTEALDVNSIAFTAPESIIGQFVIDYTGETTTYTEKTNVSATATLSVTDGTIAAGESGKFYIAIKPFSATSEQKLSLSVNGYSKEIPHSGDVTFTAGKIKKINFKYDYVPTLDTFTAINDISKLSDGASLLIVGKSGDKYYQLPVNPTVNKGKVEGVEVTVTDNAIQAYATSAWTATKSGNYWQLSSGGNNIYHSNGGNSGTNLAYGTSTAYPWSITNHNSTNRTFKLAGVSFSSATSTVNSRGMLMNGTTFGGYALSNISNSEYSAIMLFVKEEAPSTDPAIIASDITGISARGESTAESSYTIENPIDGKTISATCDGNVVTAVTVDAGTILYDVAANTTKSAREGSITLTYGDVTKVIKVSQLAPVFKLSRTSVELEAAANSSSTITVTSDFDWMSEASTNAGFTYDPTVCEWTTENPYTDGKTTVTITASAENASEEGTKTLGTLTFTNNETSEKLVVTVTQKTSYVSSDLTLTYSYSTPNGWVVSDGATDKKSYWALLGSSLSITSPSITCSRIKSIDITARKYGGPTASQATIQVKFGDTVLGTVSPTSTTLTKYTIKGPFTGSTGSFVVSCPNSTSAKGSGISQIVVTYHPSEATAGKNPTQQ